MRHCVRRGTSPRSGEGGFAVLYESGGRHEEARALAQEMLRVNPDLTAESATELVLAFGFDRDEAIGNLRSAGLP